jgi:hypothetical protein
VSDIEPSFSGSTSPLWWKSALLIAAMGLLAFIIWTLPNQGEFCRNIAQFPGLWQVPINRRIIIYLTVKVMSPLLIMGIAGISLWIASLIALSQDGMVIENSNHIPGFLHEKTAPHRTTTPPLEWQTEMPHASFPIQPPRVPRFQNPETPLPPTLSVSEALRKLADDSKPPVPDGQQALLADQKRESNEDSFPTPPVPEAFQSMAPGSFASSDPLISIRLLNDVSMTIHVPGGGHVVVPLTLNAKRVQLLAYIACRRGELIDRDKILEHVFGWGLSDEEATEDKLSERFESHKKLLRRKIREVVIEQVNKPAGRQVIDPDLDPFISDSGFWGLSDICRVDDIEAIETNYKVISQARKDGKLVDEISDYVKESCERLIAIYPGDFLEALLRKYPSEFRAWQGRSSWVRKPYTRYRDYYLEALWYAAEYEWQMGQRSTEGGNMQTEETNRRKQQEYFGRAAQKYQCYAMYACNSRFDSKATFTVHGQIGERIGMSERALRRCVVLLGAIGSTDAVNQVWSAYYTQMKSISDQRWQPSKETQDDLQAARAQTSAYRFAAQISQMSNEFTNRQDHIS